jgi:hypothetical protein
LLLFPAGEDIEILKIPIKEIPAKIENEESDHAMVLLGFFFKDESGADWIVKKPLPAHV